MVFLLSLEHSAGQPRHPHPGGPRTAPGPSDSPRPRSAASPPGPASRQPPRAARPRETLGSRDSGAPPSYPLARALAVSGAAAQGGGGPSRPAPLRTSRSAPPPHSAAPPSGGGDPRCARDALSGRGTARAGPAESSRCSAGSAPSVSRGLRPLPGSFCPTGRRRRVRGGAAGAGVPTGRRAARTPPPGLLLLLLLLAGRRGARAALDGG